MVLQAGQEGQQKQALQEQLSQLGDPAQVGILTCSTMLAHAMISASEAASCCLFCTCGHPAPGGAYVLSCSMQFVFSLSAVGSTALMSALELPAHVLQG